MDKSILIEVPVLVIGFNRPDVLRKAIQSLRESRPKNMYFACDGPREERESDKRLVDEVHNVMKNEIDWDCEKHYRFLESNQGCAKAVSSAISWVLEDNEYVVVWEDDIIAPYSFLRFCQDMLYKYKDVEEVYQVSGCNYTPMHFKDNADYTFSIHGHIWGWATWKRAWKHFDLNVNDFDEVIANVDSRNINDFYKKRIKDSALNMKNRTPRNIHGSWATVWGYIKVRDLALSIVPRKHLTSNIGIEGDHTKSQSKQHFLQYDEDFIAVNHPNVIELNEDYDIYHYQHWLKQPPYLIKQILRLIAYLRRRF